jgi:hypothetical protein
MISLGRPVLGVAHPGVLETRNGLLVEALLDAGFTVLPVNPDVVARQARPGPEESTIVPIWALSSANARRVS